MITFQKVSLVLGEKTILDDLSFQVEAGETMLLAGSSGAGKSTILKLILGLIRPDCGTITVMGHDITKLKEQELLEIRQNCGIVFQEGALFDSLTVEENVGFFLRENLKLDPQTVQDRVMTTLEFLEIHQYRNYYPAQLSGGIKKRVALARAIVSKPSILLYDEPTAGLDPLNAKRVVELISQLQKQNGVTSIIVSHEIHYFQNIVDKMIMLKDGKKFYEGPLNGNIYQNNFRWIANKESGNMRDMYEFIN